MLKQTSLNGIHDEILSLRFLGEKTNCTQIDRKGSQPSAKCTAAVTTIDFISNHKAGASYSIKQVKEDAHDSKNCSSNGWTWSGESRRGEGAK